MPTGEQAIPIGENTPVRLGVLFVAAGFLVGGGVWVGSHQVRISALETQAEKQAVEVAQRSTTSAEKAHTLELGMREVQVEVRQLRTVVERMEAKLDRQAARTTRAER